MKLAAQHLARSMLRLYSAGSLRAIRSAARYPLSPAESRAMFGQLTCPPIVIGVACLLAASAIFAVRDIRLATAQAAG